MLSDLRAWLAKNWDPDLTVGEWWERLGLAGWSAPGLPENAYGKGMARADAVLVAQEISKFGALGAPAGLGLLLAAPTIATHGTQEQIDHYVREIVTGKRPGASCSASRRPAPTWPGCRPRRCGTATNGSSTARRSGRRAASMPIWGCCWPAPTPSVPKHAGISYFAFEMLQDGVDVRPLKEMTGHALFNEVFLTDARVADSALIGGVNNGWAAANTTLDERAGRTGLGRRQRRRGRFGTAREPSWARSASG